MPRTLRFELTIIILCVLCGEQTPKQFWKIYHVFSACVAQHLAQ